LKNLEFEQFKQKQENKNLDNGNEMKNKVSFKGV
jgi:hypothetical protein